MKVSGWRERSREVMRREKGRRRREKKEGGEEGRSWNQEKEGDIGRIGGGRTGRRRRKDSFHCSSGHRNSISQQLLL